MRSAACVCLGLLFASGCYASHRSSAPDAAAPDPATTDAGVPPDAAPDAATPRPPPDAGPDLPAEPPPPDAQVVDLAGGRNHMCALTDAGEVYCWGANDVGQIAARSRFREMAPSRVRDLPPIAKVATHDSHTCAVGRAGELFCWGFSAYEQLGVPEGAIPECGRGAECSRVPLRVDVPPVARVFVANHATRASLRSGELRCWGQDRAARAVPDLREPQQLDFGLLHGCALTATGEARCFGETEFGRIGDGDRGDGLVDLRDVVQLEVGTDHACARDARDAVWCWGYDWAGSLGRPKEELPYCVHGDTGGECVVTPAPPSSEPTAIDLSVGAQRTCIVRPDRGVSCWGAWTVNDGVSWCGGRPDECDHIVTGVDGVEDAVLVETGASLACALRSDGAVLCWGWNGWGQLGRGVWEDTVEAVAQPVIGFGG